MHRRNRRRGDEAVLMVRGSGGAGSYDVIISEYSPARLQRIPIDAAVGKDHDSSSNGLDDWLRLRPRSFNRQGSPERIASEVCPVQTIPAGSVD